MKGQLHVQFANEQHGAVVWLQKKQSLQQPARYAAVHEARSAEDRRTAAELTARLAKLRNDHKDSAAHVASELSQPPPSNDKRIEAGAVERVPKEKKPWPVKVCDVPTCEGKRLDTFHVRCQYHSDRPVVVYVSASRGQPVRFMMIGTIGMLLASVTGSRCGSSESCTSKDLILTKLASTRVERLRPC